MEDTPRWKRMRFKENKVWLATDDDGTPVLKNKKVLIKYQLDQDHEYWVHPDNVRPLDAAPDTRKTASKRKGTGKSAPGKKPAAGPPKTGQTAAPHGGEDDADAVCIYTDGASSGNPGPSGIGVLLRYGANEKEISRFIGEATNNIAELEAIRAGLMELKKTDLPVRVYTDSGYAYGLLAKGWKAKKNTELVTAVKAAMKKFSDLKLIKVKGHAGHEGNERADLLATTAIKRSTE